jgi:hypothetical protein
MRNDDPLLMLDQYTSIPPTLLALDLANSKCEHCFATEAKEGCWNRSGASPRLAWIALYYVSHEHWVIIVD